MADAAAGEDPPGMSEINEHAAAKQLAGGAARAVFDMRGGRYFSLPSTEALGYGEGKPLAIEVVVRADSWARGDPVRCGGDSGLLCAAGPHRPRSCLISVVRNGRPLLGFYAMDTSAPVELPARTWMHVLFQWDADHSTQSIFVNGARAASRHVEGALLPTRAPLQLGRSHVGAGVAGDIALARVWLRAFSDEAAAALARSPFDISPAVSALGRALELSPSTSLADMAAIGAEAPTGIKVVMADVPLGFEG